MSSSKNAKRRRKDTPSEFPQVNFLYLSWSFLNFDLTSQKDLKWVFDMRWNHVSFSLPAPCSEGQILTTVCERARIPISINLVSLELRAPILSRGVTIFGYVWDEIDKIARNYEEKHMQWWISDARLTMDIVKPAPKPPEFYEVAGLLQWKMRARFPGQRWTEDQYLEIAAQLNEFPLSGLLSEDNRRRLADLNQKSGKTAIRSVAEGIAAKDPSWLHLATKKALYHAFEKFKRKRGLLIF